MVLSRLSAASSRLFSRSRVGNDISSHVPPPPADLRELARRTVPRDAVDFHTVLNIESMGTFDARVMDISPYGFQSRVTCQMLERGQQVLILLPLVGEWRGDVMWGLKGLFGCKFADPIEPDLYLDLLASMRGTDGFETILPAS